MMIRVSYGVICVGVGMMMFSSLTGCTQSKASADPTIFKCIQKGDSWETMAERGGKVSDTPLLSWKTMEFGDNFTPEKRCQIVSEKLTEAVASNGGRLRELSLTYGPVGNLTVICVVPEEAGSCDRDNMLFTLNEKNADNPSQVLADITAFSKGEKKTINEGGRPQYVLLEDLVDKGFKDKSVW